MPIDNKSLYDLVDRTRLELKGDINRLENKFDTLEAGRLTRLEDRVGRQQVSMATAATKLGILGFIASTIVGALVGALASGALGRIFK